MLLPWLVKYVESACMRLGGVAYVASDEEHASLVCRHAGEVIFAAWTLPEKNTKLRHRGEVVNPQEKIPAKYAFFAETAAVEALMVKLTDTAKESDAR